MELMRHIVVTIMPQRHVNSCFVKQENTRWTI